MTSKPIKSRNPLVVPARFRKAGPHGPTTKARRRAEKMEVDKSASEEQAVRDKKGAAE